MATSTSYDKLELNFLFPVRLRLLPSQLDSVHTEERAAWCAPPPPLLSRGEDDVYLMSGCPGASGEAAAKTRTMAAAQVSRHVALSI